MSLSKRQARRNNSGRTGQPSRPERRASKRLAIATASYDIQKNVAGKQKMCRKPGSVSHW